MPTTRRWATGSQRPAEVRPELPLMPPPGAPFLSALFVFFSMELTGYRRRLSGGGFQHLKRQFTLTPFFCPAIPPPPPRHSCRVRSQPVAPWTVPPSREGLESGRSSSAQRCRDARRAQLRLPPSLSSANARSISPRARQPYFAKSPFWQPLHTSAPSGPKIYTWMGYSSTLSSLTVAPAPGKLPRRALRDGANTGSALDETG